MTEEKTAPPLLDLEGVSKIYGELHALDNVSLQVPAGQWVSIVGPSGSGKTTLMNIVGCMDTPSRGKVLLDGHDISDLTGDELTEIRRSTIGLVFQQFHLIGHLTALENIMVAQYYHSMPDEKEAMEALDRVGLADRATHLPRQLSGGEQQRVCVARALINYPKLILADEPTGNLDETNEGIVLDLFGQLHKEGTTLMVVTHDALVASQGQREIALDHGRVLKETWHDHDLEKGNRPIGTDIDMSLPMKDGVWKGQSNPDDQGAIGIITIVVENGDITNTIYETKQADGSDKGRNYGKDSSGQVFNEEYYARAQRAVDSFARYSQELTDKDDPTKVDVISGATVAHSQFMQAAIRAISAAQGVEASGADGIEIPGLEDSTKLGGSELDKDLGGTGQ